MLKIEIGGSPALFGAGSHGYLQLVHVDSRGHRTILAQIHGNWDDTTASSSGAPNYNGNFLVGEVWVNGDPRFAQYTGVIRQFVENSSTGAGNTPQTDGLTIRRDPAAGDAPVIAVFSGDDEAVLAKFQEALDVALAIDRSGNPYHLNVVGPINSNAFLRFILEALDLPVLLSERAELIDIGNYPGFDTAIPNVPGYQNVQPDNHWPTFITRALPGRAGADYLSRNSSPYSARDRTRVNSVVKTTVPVNGLQVERYTIQLADGRFVVQFEWVDGNGIIQGERYIFDDRGGTIRLLQADRYTAQPDSVVGTQVTSRTPIDPTTLGADSNGVLDGPLNIQNPTIRAAISETVRRHQGSPFPPGIQFNVYPQRSGLRFQYAVDMPGGGTKIVAVLLEPGSDILGDLNEDIDSVPLVTGLSDIEDLDSLQEFMSRATLQTGDGTLVPASMVAAMGAAMLLSLYNYDALVQTAQGAGPTGSDFLAWLLGDGRQYFQGANYGNSVAQVVFNRGSGQILGVMVRDANGASRTLEFIPDPNDPTGQTIIGVRDSVSGDEIAVERLDDLVSATAPILQEARIVGQVQEIGAIFNIIGSSLGRILSDDPAISAIAGGVIGTIAENIGEVIGELLFREVDLGDAISNAFDDLPTELQNNIISAGVGAVSSLLAAELIESLGAEGFAGELLQTVASTTISTIINNLIAEVSPFAGVGPAIVNSVASFLGAQLAAQIIEFDSVGGQLGASIGSSILSMLAISHAAEITSFLGIGAIGGPIGIFIGAFVGYILGGLIGSLFGGGGTPSAWADVQFNAETGEFFVTGIGSKNKGNVEGVKSLATAAAETLNAVIKNAIGGEVINVFENTVVGRFGIRGDSVQYAEYVGGTQSPAFVLKENDPNELLSQGIVKAFEGLVIAGGDTILKRALYNSLDQVIDASGNVTGDIESIVGNLQIARDYQLYLTNAPVIGALIATLPDSAFAAGWILTLQKAKELGLDKRHEADWYGGLGYFLSHRMTTAANVDHVMIGTARQISILTIDGQSEMVSDTIQSSAKDRIIGTASSDTITILGDMLQGNALLKINGVQSTGVAQKIGVAAILDGGAGDDTIVGGDLGNDIFGGAGNDTLTGGVLDDWIFGGDGNDTLNSGGGNGDVLMGEAGNDALNGLAGSDWLDGGDGDDTLTGGAGDDILAGSAGTDLLKGQDGNDQYILKEGDGVDEVQDIGTVTAPVSFNAAAGLGNWRGLGQYVAQVVGGGGGTQTGDTVAAGGEDTVVLGAGITMNDVVLTRSGTTQSPGNDLLLKIRRYDAQQQPYFAEQYTLKNWFDPFQRVEYLQFADGQKIRIGDFTTFTVGTAGNDVIIGTNGNDFVNGGAGDDHIELLLGDDFGAGDRGADFVAGDGGNDIVVGGSENDRLMGGAGNDVVSGDQGDDYATGDDGNDIVTGGAGNDNLSGGAGDDVFRFNRGDGRDTLVDARSGTWENITDASGNYVNGYVAETVEVPLFDDYGQYMYNDFGQVLTYDSVQVRLGGEILFNGYNWLANIQYNAATGVMQRLVEDPNGAISDQGTDTLEFAIGIDINDIQMEWQGADLVMGVARSGASVSTFATLTDQIRLKNWSTVKGIEKVGFYNTGQVNTDSVGAWGGGTDGDDTINGTASMDWLTGNGGNDTIDGGAGNDIINGNGGLDILKGGDGVDSLVGGAGDDVLDGGAGGDNLVGGSGFDLVSYASSTDAVRIYLDDRYMNQGMDVWGDTRFDIEGVIGSNYADILSGTADDNELAGGAGNDELYGDLGDDIYVFERDDGQDTVIDGGITTGTIVVRDAQGVLSSQFEAVEYETYQWWWQGPGLEPEFPPPYEPGDPNYVVVQNIDYVHKKSGAHAWHWDTWASSGPGVWQPGYTPTGNGQEVTGPGEVASTENGGDDTLELGEDIFFGDLTFTRVGNNLQIGILGTSDVITLNNQTNSLTAIETLMLSTGQSANLVNLKINELGGTGDDFVVGDGAVNALNGGAGHDVISGAAGGDVLIGGDGDDMLDGGDGADELQGGLGVDTASYTGAAAGVTVNLATGLATGSEAQDDMLADVENVLGSDFADTLTGSTAANSLSGGKGNDTVAGGDGDDVVAGGDGDDTVSGQVGDDIVQAGAGNDTASGGDGNDLVFGDDGNDTLTGDTGTDKLYGGAGTDSLNAGAGDDELYGGDGNDALTGGEGADKLFGEGGTDTMDGGAGDDVYAFNAASGADTVTDSAGADVVVFDPSIATTQLWFKQVNNDLQISVIGTTTVVTLTNHFTQSDKPAEQIVVGDKLLYLSQVAPLMALMTGSVPATVGDVPQGVKDVLAQYWHVDGKAKPFVPAQSLTTALNTAATGTLSVNDHDDNFDAYAISQQGAHGSLTLNTTTGAFTYTPTTGFEGYDQAIVSATDGDGQTTTSTLSFKVGNFAPTIGAIDDVGVGVGLSSSPIAFTVGDVETAVGSLTVSVASSDTNLVPLSALVLGGSGANRTLTVSPPYSVTGAGVTVTVTVSDGAKSTNETFVLTTDYNVIGGTFENDTLNGTSVADKFLLQSGGDDAVTGSGGNDAFAFGSAYATGDTVDGGAGTDVLQLDGNYATTLTLTAAMLANVEEIQVATGNSYNLTLADANVASGQTLLVSGTTLAETNVLTVDGTAETNGVLDLRGGGGADAFVGGAGADALAGNGGKDFIQGRAGNDTITGGDGDDWLDGGAGGDAIDGGAGLDVAAFGASGSAVNANLATSTYSGGDAVGDTLTNIEGLSGSSLADTLTGNTGNNQLFGQAGNDTLSGGDGDDILDGGAGADSLTGGNGSDTAAYWTSAAALVASLATPASNTGDAAGDTYSGIENLSGGSGNDTLTGDANANALDGGAGNDLLVGGAGTDTFVGGAGTDTVSYAASAASLTANLATPASNSGDAAGETYSGVENLTGGSAADTLTGDAGANALDGGAGNDVLSGGAGADALIGNSGTDTASYASSTAAVVASLTTPANNTGDAAGDTYSGIENLTGGTGADTLTGDATANAVDGGDGDDTLIGGTGADVLTGGSGADTASYTTAAAAVTASLTTPGGNTGEAAGDTYSGIESLTGGAFNDTLTGDASANTLDGGGGIDVLIGGAGADVLIGGTGTDTASYATSAATVVASLTAPASNTGDAAGDTYSSIENLAGGTGNDTLTGDTGANALDGGNGNDVLVGGAGGDLLTGGAGTDTVDYSTAAAGVVANLTTPGGNTGDAAGDTYATIENLTGSAFDDTLTGTTTANALDGGAGNDVLVGGAGADTLTGGSGTDTASYAPSTTAVTANLTTGAGTVGDATGDTYSGIENLIGGSVADTLTGDALANVIDGGAGNDSLTGNDGDDTLIGGAGADALNGGNGADTASYATSALYVVANLTTPGSNQLDAAGDTYTSIENLTGSAFNDTLTGNTGANTLDGGAGNDILIGGAGADTLIGGDGTGDAASYSTSAAAIVASLATPASNTGDAAGDTYSGIENLTGGTGADTLTGDANDNTLMGGGGADALAGGDGVDTASYLMATAAVVANLTTAAGTAGEATGDTYSGIENLRGSDFADTLTGDANANAIDGGNGNDVLIGGAGADTLTGGVGTDFASYTTAAAAVLANLSAPVENTGDAAGDTYNTIEGLTGSAYNDTLIGNTSANWLDGGSGDDLLIGGAGADAMTGGLGTDTVSYAASAVGIMANLATSTGGLGEAVGDTYSGVENVIGGSGNDTLTGSTLANTLDGGAGNDTITAGDGNDILIGGAGTDALTGGNGTDVASYATATAAVKADLISAASNTGDAAGDTYNTIENLMGSAYDDSLRGTTAVNTLDGGTGNDILIGDAGADVLIGGDGSDTASYSTATAAVVANLTTPASNTGHAAGDTYNSIENLTGGTAADTLTGDANANVLDGGAANDTLAGNDGDDTLIGGAGADTLTGGNGSDTASYATSTANIVANLTTPASNTGDAAGDTYTSIENLTGGSGADTLTGNASANALNGGSGNDLLIGGAGADALTGGAGIDTASYAAASAAVIANLAAPANNTGDAAGDTYAGVENLTGSAFDDTLGSDAAANVMDGGAGTDTVSYAGASGAVTAGLATPAGNTGEAAGDTYTAIENLTGGAFDDMLTGDANANVVAGGAGSDTLSGGAGSDTYTFGRGDGADILNNLDNSASTDRLVFGADVAHDQLWFQRVGNNLVVSIIGTADKVSLRNWFASSPDKLDEIRTSTGKVLTAANVQTLVDAMAAYSPPALGETTLPSNLQTALGSTINSTWQNILPPVILDLDGNGFRFTPWARPVRFDADNDGTKEWVSWFSGGDGVLALDRNHDGLITSGIEISFVGDKPGALTDLQGLTAFDTNGNSKLDAGDAKFKEFKVWIDRNQNGRSDPGELKSLSDMGITSIALTGTPATEEQKAKAPGLNATAVVTYRNGKTGLAADAELSFSDERPLAYPLGSSTPVVPIAQPEPSGNEAPSARQNNNEQQQGTQTNDEEDEQAQLSSPTETSAVMVDLNANGLKTSLLPSRFDVDGDGNKEWAHGFGRRDGVLSLDRNADGVIAGPNEISFIGDKQGATTEFEGLSAFDTNNNGKLDGGDLKFNDFMVWLDRNRNGRSDAGELNSLTDLGITSIALIGTAATAEQKAKAFGLNTTTVVTFSDGETSLAGDVEIGECPRPHLPWLSDLFDWLADRLDLEAEAAMNNRLSKLIDAMSAFGGENGVGDAGSWHRKSLLSELPAVSADTSLRHDRSFGRAA